MENPFGSRGVSEHPAGSDPFVHVHVLGDWTNAPVSIGFPNENTDTDGMGEAEDTMVTR